MPAQLGALPSTSLGGYIPRATNDVDTLLTGLLGQTIKNYSTPDYTQEASARGVNPEIGLLGKIMGARVDEEAFNDIARTKTLEDRTQSQDDYYQGILADNAANRVDRLPAQQAGIDLQSAQQAQIEESTRTSKNLNDQQQIAQTQKQLTDAGYEADEFVGKLRDEEGNIRSISEIIAMIDAESATLLGTPSDTGELPEVSTGTTGGLPEGSRSDAEIAHRQLVEEIMRIAEELQRGTAGRPGAIGILGGAGSGFPYGQ